MDAIKIEQAKSDYQKIVSFIEDGSPLPPETDPYWEACAALDRLGGFIADIEGAKNTKQLLQPNCVSYTAVYVGGTTIELSY